jgi:F420-non-reducing hydrogenase iron-sulfur subunit
MEKYFKPALTLFHCINSVKQDVDLEATDGTFSVKTVKLPCTGMVKDVYLLRALEAGADGVVVLACPEGECRYIEGNLRAKKRVEWVRQLLDEIGLGSRRIMIFNVSPEDNESLNAALNRAAEDIRELGPNPATSR